MNQPNPTPTFEQLNAHVKKIANEQGREPVVKFVDSPSIQPTDLMPGMHGELDHIDMSNFKQIGPGVDELDAETPEQQTARIEKEVAEAVKAYNTEQDLAKCPVCKKPIGNPICSACENRGLANGGWRCRWHVLSGWEIYSVTEGHICVIAKYCDSKLNEAIAKRIVEDHNFRINNS